MGIRGGIAAVGTALLLASTLPGAAARGGILHEPVADGTPMPPTYWFNQSISHYNALNNNWFMQRYWVNDTYAQSWLSTGGTGPLFLVLQGEWTASGSSVLNGFAVQLASNFSALVISLEHRYYGQSVPVSSLTENNLAYHSSLEAIADVASFVTFAYSNWTGIDKVVAFGCSYAGFLAASARGTLPHLIHAAVASSGPMEAQPQGHEAFNSMVATALADPSVGGSPACLEGVVSAFQQLTVNMGGDPNTQQLYSCLMQSCDVASSDKDVMWFMTNLATIIQLGVQYNGSPGRPGDPATNISRICSFFPSRHDDDDGDAAISALARLVKDSLNYQGNGPLSSVAGWIPVLDSNGSCRNSLGSCIDNSWADYLTSVAGNVTVDPTTGSNDARAWFWQCCTQFGFCSWGSCQNSTTCPFSPLMTIEAPGYDLCWDAFDSRVAPPNNIARYQWTNAYLGGYNTAAGRVLFVNGGRDPWSTISSTPANNLNPSNPTIIIPGGSHCNDYYTAQPNESPELAAAHAAIYNQVAEWLNEPRYGFPTVTTADSDQTLPLMTSIITISVLGGVLLLTCVGLLLALRRGGGGGGGSSSYSGAAYSARSTRYAYGGGDGGVNPWK